MTPDLAVASITLALKQRLQSALNRAGGLGGEVRTERPDKMTDTASPVVNLYLYQVGLNPFMLNNDVEPIVVRKPGQISAELIQTYKSPLDLDYMLAFYGDERALTPQRLMATCIAALHRQPVLPANVIAAAAAAQYPGIDTTLTADVEDVDISFSRLTMEDIYRLWSSFKAPFALSVVYRVQTAIVYSTPETEPVDLVDAVDIRIALPEPPHPGPPIGPGGRGTS